MNTPDIQQQRPFRVLLIGDSCIDEYKIGTVDRLSPEAPVPVIRIVNTEQLPGMAANVKINLENLGITPDFITNDAQILKTRYIDQRSGQHMLRVDSEPAVPEWNGETLLVIDEYDAIIISDYNKGFLSYEKIEKLICSTDCPVFIDTKKTDLDRFSGDRVWIKINRSE